MLFRSLVVNTAKYLDGQPVLAFNPDPARIDGVLLPFGMEAADETVRAALAGRLERRGVTMARATLDDGQSIEAVNDIFIGTRSHASARYRIEHGGRERALAPGLKAAGHHAGIERGRDPHDHLRHDHLDEPRAAAERRHRGEGGRAGHAGGASHDEHPAVVALARLAAAAGKPRKVGWQLEGFHGRAWPRDDEIDSFRSVPGRPHVATGAGGSPLP